MFTHENSRLRAMADVSAVGVASKRVELDPLLLSLDGLISALPLLGGNK